MAWVFMVLLITPVQFILGLNLKEGRGLATLTLASFIGSMTRGAIIKHTVRTIRCLTLILFLTTTVVRTRIME